MFKTYNKNGHKFLNSRFYKIKEVLDAYRQYRKTNKPVACKDIVFDKVNHYLEWLIQVDDNNIDLRCPICGCKANHFRLCKETSNNWVLHLFGIYHIKGTKDAEYVFFNKDHILPKSMGGYNGYSNIRLICEHCNTERGNDTKALTQKESKKLKKLKIESEVTRIKNRIYEMFNYSKKKFTSCRDREYINFLVKFISSQDNAFFKKLFTKPEKK